MAEPPLVSASAARRLFLGAQGLLDDPGGSVSRARLQGLITRLGFVQVDSIMAVERAHHLTLASRLEQYRPAQLTPLLEGKRALFEHWTHDASLIPLAWYAQWKPRFRRDQPRIEGNAWWQNLLGDDCQRVCAHVLERITEEGPLGSADFDHPEKRGPWWGWKPQKAALDYLWRTGRLAIHGREKFQKRYDLPDRVFPAHHVHPEPEPAAHLEWACSSASERLIVFTPKELAGFWEAVHADEAKVWCAIALKEGRLQAVRVEGADGSDPRPAFALADWESRLGSLPEAPRLLRLLSPFDPVLRDRARALRRFDFDYRFEAFVPEPKRTYGYYVLPLLEGDRLVGRADAKSHRVEGVLELKQVWWETGIKGTKARARRLEEATGRLAESIGASEIRILSGP